MSTLNPSWKETIDQLKEDARRYAQNTPNIGLQGVKNLYSHPSFAAVTFYRIGRWALTSRPRWIPQIVYFLFRVAYPIMRWYSGVEFQPRSQIGPGLCILHFGPTIVHPDTIAGYNLTILPGVTIGEANNGTPILGDNVAVGTGAIIIGAIRIGNNVNIGAGSVVTRDLPDNCTAVGVPAKPLHQKAEPAEN